MKLNTSPQKTSINYIGWLFHFLVRHWYTALSFHFWRFRHTCTQRADCVALNVCPINRCNSWSFYRK